MPKKNKKKQESYFSNVIHMRDDIGTYCAASRDGDLYNKEPQDVTCNKCLHFLEHPGLLEAKRKRAKEKVEPIFEKN